MCFYNHISHNCLYVGGEICGSELPPNEGEMHPKVPYPAWVFKLLNYIIEVELKALFYWCKA